MLFIHRPPRGVKGRPNDQPGQNQELVPKRGTTSVAWSRVFKHCSFKTTDFMLLKHKQQSYMRAPSNTSYVRAPSLSVRGARFFFVADFEQLHKHTVYASESPSL